MKITDDDLETFFFCSFISPEIKKCNRDEEERTGKTNMVYAHAAINCRYESKSRLIKSNKIKQAFW